MRKLEFCLCKNIGADQLHSNCTADQCLSFFRYKDSTITLLLKSEIFFGCTGRFVSDLVRNHKDRFSCVAAHVKNV